MATSKLHHLNDNIAVLFCCEEYP